jgi:hypothetical protein
MWSLGNWREKCGDMKGEKWGSDSADFLWEIKGNYLRGENAWGRRVVLWDEVCKG